MARRAYFAFHFEQDIFRVNLIRGSNVLLGTDEAGFFDHSEYNEAKAKSDDYIRRVIRERISGTSVTVVLAWTCPPWGHPSWRLQRERAALVEEIRSPRAGSTRSSSSTPCPGS